MRSTKRKTLQEAIIGFKAKHGNDYDYSLIDKYVNNKTPVQIKCNTCGLVFPQTPHAHLAGQGCPRCGIRKNSQKRTGKSNFGNKKKVLGVGVNDYPFPVNSSGKTMTAYNKWNNILQRCFSGSWKENKPTYKDCTICEEWKTFSNFLKWFDENYKEGYVIDKDILIKGNKLYSPDTCCCVPPRINGILINRTNDRGKYPVGVSFHKGKYTGSVSTGTGSSIYIGIYDNPQDAFNAYKNIKENYIKEVAQEYYNEGKITKRVYDALMRYEVEITD